MSAIHHDPVIVDVTWTFDTPDMIAGNVRTDRVDLAHARSRGREDFDAMRRILAIAKLGALSYHDVIKIVCTECYADTGVALQADAEGILVTLCETCHGHVVEDLAGDPDLDPNASHARRTAFVTYGGNECCLDVPDGFLVTVTNAIASTTYETCPEHRDACAATASGYVAGWGTVHVTVEKKPDLVADAHARHQAELRDHRV